MPHELPLFTDLLILLVASVPIAFICHRLRLPVIVGFMVTGILIGPSSLRLIKNTQAIEALAEIGVALLLFTIGLEFSLRRLLEMKRLVLGGGGLQVILTILFALAIQKLLGRPLNQALFFGFLCALSSTAIVLKSYVDRQEIDAPHGRAGVGILLFQDLCIVPMMLLTPILSGQEGSSVTNIALTLGKAAAVIAGIIFAARTVVPWLLFHVTRLRSPEVFIIFVVLVSLGTAWLTSHFGLSMALGAFIAGLVLSESEYSHQIVSDILPFRDVFNSIFFMSIGMLLSFNSLLEHFSTVMVWLAAIIVGKALIVTVVARLLRYSLRVAVMIGLGLAQVGEFSFILAKVGSAQNLLSQADYQLFLAASILSMIATPFLINAAPRLGFTLQSRFFPRLAGPAEQIAQADSTHDRNHVLVIGYGMNGRNLSKVLHHLGIPYLVLELNAETVRAARAQGVPIQYGDAGRRQVLQHVGAERAAIIVLAISDPVMTRHTVVLARELNPDVHIIVRTRYMSEVAGLFGLGASEVVPEEFETSVEIFSRVLKLYGVPRSAIEREIDEVRKEGYEMLRSPSLPLVEINRLAQAFADIASETVFISNDSPVLGKTLKELDLRQQTGATVTAIVRDGKLEINPGPDFSLAANDILVLLGKPEQAALAEEYLRQGRVKTRSATGKLRMIYPAELPANTPREEVQPGQMDNHASIPATASHLFPGGGWLRRFTHLSPLKSLAVAVLLVAAALLLTQIFSLLAPFTFHAAFIGAIALSVLLGGVKAGLVSLAGSLVAINYFYVSPLYSLTLNAGDLVRLGAFSLVILIAYYQRKKLMSWEEPTSGANLK